mmetsp:Transcript_6060/g.11911  ORF Transcript_6060/g.11911 Transcript_6060/m.11911 type:complete len:86 (-) Transcript_6060:581-838(-)
MALTRIAKKCCIGIRFAPEHFFEREMIGMVSILRKDRQLPCAVWQLVPTIPAVKSSDRNSPAIVLDPPTVFHHHLAHPAHLVCGS